MQWCGHLHECNIHNKKYPVEYLPRALVAEMPDADLE